MSDSVGYLSLQHSYNTFFYSFFFSLSAFYLIKFLFYLISAFLCVCATVMDSFILLPLLSIEYDISYIFSVNVTKNLKKIYSL